MLLISTILISGDYCTVEYGPLRILAKALHGIFLFLRPECDDSRVVAVVVGVGVVVVVLILQLVVLVRLPCANAR